MTETDVLILGAGAAGLMCAIHAGRRGRRVVVLEHADRPGKKILISGGGRCNFTNIHAGPENYISANPHFARSVLARYTPADFLSLVESHGIPWHEKTLGQLFCDRSAHDILNLLLAECKMANVRLQLSTTILSVGQSGAAFRVETSAGPVQAKSVVVATGGLSIPKMGATSLGYEIARQFRHPIVEPRPALVPLVLSAEDQASWCDLAGLSAAVIAKAAAGPARDTMAAAVPAPRRKSGAVPPAFREKMLITHRGLSGPAILQVSSYWRPGELIELDLAPAQSVFAALSSSSTTRDLGSAAAALRGILPARLATRWLEQNALTAHVDRRNLLSNAAIAALERDLHVWRITPSGTEGYAKAEVTAGGVSTDVLDARTMQSRITAGLYFIGEVVDVTGWLGGYNFQWAWASGVAAGQSV
jgi:predicted Rossmann fold flavoprotein